MLSYLLYNGNYQLINELYMFRLLYFFLWIYPRCKDRYKIVVHDHDAPPTVLQLENFSLILFRNLMIFGSPIGLILTLQG